MYKYGLSLFLNCIFVATGIAKTLPGLDVFLAKPIETKRIGLICNQTSRTAGGGYGPDEILKNKQLQLTALFSPEHGINGVRKAGDFSDTVEKYRGIPVYSLYGSTRKPTPSMLRGVDALIFDIQDIGVRPYTYLSTMILAMEAAAEQGKEFMVFDRPNPLGGERIEGNILDTALKSFVGQVPTPYIHGMTLGELAQMAKGEKWFKSAAKLQLTVIPMSEYKRSMTWEATGFEWVAPSPNIPSFESAVGAALLGATGELGVLAIGIGSDKPFLRIGSKLISRDSLYSAIQQTMPSELKFFQQDFTVPFDDTVKTYNGVRIDLPKNIASISDLYSGQFQLFSLLLRNEAFSKAFSSTTLSTKIMYEKVTGTTAVLEALRSKKDLGPIISRWKSDAESFRIRRKKYLLYR